MIPPSRQTMHRALTLVEMMVALLVIALVIGMAWQLFIGERRRFEADQERLSGLQGALLLDEYLAWDLERILLDLPDTPKFTVENPVVIVPSRSLEFRIADPKVGTAPGVRPVPVVYSYDPAAGRVSRSVDGKARVIPGLIAENVQFDVVTVPLKWPSAEHPKFAPGVPLKYVKYVLTCISETQMALSRERRNPTGKVTLVGSVALRPRMERAHHHYWRNLRSELLEAP